MLEERIAGLKSRLIEYAGLVQSMIEKSIRGLMWKDERLLREVIRTLDPVRQELLVLKFAEGLSNAEIGEILGRSEGAIKSLYHRTLLQLREEMQKRERGE